MAGDHLQLAPTVLSSKAQKMGLDISLLQQAVTQAPTTVVLSKVQYRMHKNIMSFPSHHFYEGKLEADIVLHLHFLRIGYQ
jgi:superfamily I DNA and/or RNA helicase